MPIQRQFAGRQVASIKDQVADPEGFGRPTPRSEVRQNSKRQGVLKWPEPRSNDLGHISALSKGRMFQLNPSKKADFRQFSQTHLSRSLSRGALAGYHGAQDPSNREPHSDAAKATVVGPHGFDQELGLAHHSAPQKGSSVELGMILVLFAIAQRLRRIPYSPASNHGLKPQRTNICLRTSLPEP